MTNPVKTSSFQIVSNLIGVLLGVFLASFFLSFVMTGIWAFVLAIVGGAVTSLAIRFIKIRVKTMLPGLIIGYFVFILIWAGKHWSLSVNLWVSAVYALTLGIVRTFISDDLLVNWLNKTFSASGIQNKS